MEVWSGPCGHGGPPVTYDHVIWIWMENHGYDEIAGSHDAPFTNSLAAAPVNDPSSTTAIRAGPPTGSLDMSSR